ncbi:hypothetical protein K7X08_028542 [Anisodus acutangulus]|uniref:AP2/ERF domain-containing protein n=1 Tax=Anisodus acutangulus TaxID=402998 RepID=A0A9Q1RE17_9SOLA|nr:hypothetical protein K7X08_028542 [Anisodus acutangulus]
MDIFGNFYFNPLPLVPTTSTSTSNNSSCGKANSSDEEVMLLASKTPKRRAGRKKFRETRHPIYRGVRRRNSEKWVSEVRVPGKKSRIWLGTFPNAEMAARAHDVAVIALKGRSACLNFADSAWRLPIPASAAAKDIQKAAAEAAESFRPLEWSDGESFKEVITVGDQVIQDIIAADHDVAAIALTGCSSCMNFADTSSAAKDILKAAAEVAEAFLPSESSEGENSDEVAITDQVLQYVINSSWRLPMPASVAANDIHKAAIEAAAEAFSTSESSDGENSEKVSIVDQVIQDIVIAELQDYNVAFMDEEALFYMPGLLVNMAEGLMLPPPPQCIDGYDMEPHDIDMSLWSY